MRKSSLENASPFLGERTKEIERLHDGPRMFKVVRLLQGRLHSTLTVHDEFKHVIMDKHKVSAIVAKHFESQFQEGEQYGIDMFEGSLKSLDSLITAKEDCKCTRICFDFK